MSYFHTKVIVEKIEITRVIPNYIQSYRVLKRHRPEIHGCELCEKTFSDSDPVALAFTKQDPYKTTRRTQNRIAVRTPANPFICMKCADMAIQGGAESTTLNQQEESL